MNEWKKQMELAAVKCLFHIKPCEVLKNEKRSAIKWERSTLENKRISLWD